MLQPVGPDIYHLGIDLDRAKGGTDGNEGKATRFPRIIQCLVEELKRMH